MYLCAYMFLFSLSNTNMSFACNPFRGTEYPTISDRGIKTRVTKFGKCHEGKLLLCFEYFLFVFNVDVPLCSSCLIYLQALSEQDVMEKSELLTHIEVLEKELSCLSTQALAKEKENLRKDLEKTKKKLETTEFKLKNAIQEKTKLEVLSYKYFLPVCSSIK